MTHGLGITIMVILLNFQMLRYGISKIRLFPNFVISRLFPYIVISMHARILLISCLRFDCFTNDNVISFQPFRGAMQLREVRRPRRPLSDLVKSLISK